MKNLYVIKCGGNFVMKKAWISSFLATLKNIIDDGNFVIIVHGGGPQADDLAKKLNVPIKKKNGKRITDFQTLQITKMIYAGLINSELVSLCINKKIQTIGISGISGKIVEVIKRSNEPIDFGYVGDIKKINKKPLEMFLENGYVPVISCLGVDDSGQVFNVNADGLAAHIAIAFKAKKLIFVSDIVGVAEDKDKKIILNVLSLLKAKKLIIKKIIRGGMIPKIESAHLAIEKNVKTVQILGALNNKKQWADAILNNKFGTILTGENL